jgi:hypothetical protein
MRPHSSAEAALLRARRVTFSLRVEIRHGITGAWVDYSNAYGVNWIREVRWEASIDRPVMSGTVRLLREDMRSGVSLSPTIGASIANSGGILGVAEGNPIRISCAVTAPGVAPVAGDWREVFLGEVDEVEYGKRDNAITVGFRDIGARVLDNVMQAERVYGAAGGIPMPDVMQSILDDNLGAGAVTLYTPVPFAFAVRAYRQQQKSVLEALNDLAAQLGYVVRYAYDAAGVFRLTLYDPQRTKTVPDASFGPGEYVDLPTLKRSRDDVRNQVRVLFTDPSGVAWDVYREDAASIALYGPRYMQMGLDAASQITNTGQAGALADAALSDLAAPLAEHACESFLFWPVELGRPVHVPAEFAAIRRVAKSRGGRV